MSRLHDRLHAFRTDVKVDGYMLLLFDAGKAGKARGKGDGDGDEEGNWDVRLIVNEIADREVKLGKMIDVIPLGYGVE